MKRLHIHLKTQDLETSIAYYEALFGEAPTVREDDYAKWLIDEPAANISLSTHGGAAGIDHVGLSFDTEADLETVADRLTAANLPSTPEKNTTCCYAQSNKYWSRDPQGAIWELFQTFGESENYGAEPDRVLMQTGNSCCAPQN